MLNMEIARNEWLFFALIGGLILLLLTVLSYAAIWRSRESDDEARIPIRDIKSFLIWIQRTFPWILILTMMGTDLLVFIYPILRANRPPNW